MTALKRIQKTVFLLILILSLVHSVQCSGNIDPPYVNLLAFKGATFYFVSTINVNLKTAPISLENPPEKTFSDIDNKIRIEEMNSIYECLKQKQAAGEVPFVESLSVKDNGEDINLIEIHLKVDDPDLQEASISYNGIFFVTTVKAKHESYMYWSYFGFQEETYKIVRIVCDYFISEKEVPENRILMDVYSIVEVVGEEFGFHLTNGTFQKIYSVDELRKHLQYVGIKDSEWNLTTAGLELHIASTDIYTGGETHYEKIAYDLAEYAEIQYVFFEVERELKQHERDCLKVFQDLDGGNDFHKTYGEKKARIVLITRFLDSLDVERYSNLFRRYTIWNYDDPERKYQELVGLATDVDGYLEILRSIYEIKTIVRDNRTMICLTFIILLVTLIVSLSNVYYAMKTNEMNKKQIKGLYEIQNYLRRHSRQPKNTIIRKKWLIRKFKNEDLKLYRLLEEINRNLKN